MSMQWITLQQAQEETGGTITVTQHWYLTEDKTRVVPEGDTDGRWLWASPGTAVPLSEAIRYGAVKVEPEPEPEKSVIEQLVEDDGFDPEEVAKAVRENPLDLGKPLDDEHKGPEAAVDGHIVGETEPETGTAIDDTEVVDAKKAKQAPNKAAKKAANKAATSAEDK